MKGNLWQTVRTFLHRHLLAWHWSGALFAVLCLTNVPSLLQRDLFEGASLAALPRAALLGEEAVRVAGCAWLLTLACGFLPRACRRLLAAASALLCLVDLFTLRQYHSVLDAGLLEVVAATNPAEAVEYATSQAGALAPFLAGAAGAAVLWYFRGRLGGIGRRLLLGRTARARGAQEMPRSSRPARRGGRRPLVLAGLVLLAFALSLVQAGRDPAARAADVPRALSLYRLASNIAQAREEIGSAAYVDYLLAQKPVQLSVEPRDPIPYVVFILGESTSRHHMSLYGYGLPTTPRLDARDARGELAVFRAVTSPHAGTMAVMRTLFSFYDNEAPGLWYEYGNLFDILREAGVQTAWLSNQEASGFYGSIGRTLGGRCDIMQFTSHLSHSIDLSERYDGELLPLLDDTLAAMTEDGPHFLVLHLMGAHEEFGRRYPEAYAQFTEEDERGRGVAATRQAREVRAAYDNAVLYDDAVVDAIIERFEGRDAVVVFLSDHGEEVYDVRDLAGHGDESSPWQRDIPCVFWMSEAFRARHAADAARIRRAVGTPWQSDEMIHTLLDLMQIRAEEYEEGKSLLTPMTDDV